MRKSQCSMHIHKSMRTDVANQNLRYSFHENHQPITVFAISSSNKILLSILYIVVEPFWIQTSERKHLCVR